jgi:hypothetical protein
MRCYICDRALNEPVFNREHNTWEPCKECLEAIEDTLAAFTDRPSAAEDEFGIAPSILLDNIPKS